MRAITFGPPHVPRLGLVTPKGVLAVAAAVDTLRNEGATANGVGLVRIAADPQAFYATGLDARRSCSPSSPTRWREPASRRRYRVVEVGNLGYLTTPLEVEA